MHGLLIAPSWLIALLERDLDTLLWNCDIAVLTEPQKYIPLTGNVHYFDRSSIVRSLYGPKSRWEEQGSVHFVQRAAPKLGVPLKAWERSALGARDCYWHPPSELMQAWSHWYCGSTDWQWEITIMRPWLSLLTHAFWSYAASIAPLSRSAIWEGEELPALDYYDKKWWFKGCGYDFCIVASGGDLITHNIAPMRPIFWDGVTAAANYRSSARRIMRYALYQNTPLTLSHQKPGLFFLPLFWPLRLETLEEQWRILITLLYTHQGLLCF